MKIQKMISQHRRDFKAVFVCENCGHTEEKYGYDDSNFHRNVIPSMQCTKCGETSPEDYKPNATKYRDFEII